MTAVAIVPNAACARRAARAIALALSLLAPLPALAAQKPVPPDQPSDRIICRGNCQMKYPCHDLPRNYACFRDFNACIRKCG